MAPSPSKLPSGAVAGSGCGVPDGAAGSPAASAVDALTGSADGDPKGPDGARDGARAVPYDPAPSSSSSLVSSKLLEAVLFKGSFFLRLLLTTSLSCAIKVCTRPS